MAGKRDVKLDKYNIGRNLYRELLYFCRQYDEKKAELSSLYQIGATVYSDMPKGGSTGAPTESKALRAACLSSDIDMIERAARRADGEIYAYIIANVTRDRLPYEYLSVPGGRRNFYEKRRRFFYYLAKEKGMI